METAVIAAALAAVASIVGAAVSWFGAHQARRTAVRHHAWDRFTWALDQRPGSSAYNISTAVLRNLATVTSWPKADRRLARRALASDPAVASQPPRPPRQPPSSSPLQTPSPDEEPS
ncbi:hypothetical protein [Curtobacterium sp. MCBA15_004]|uniref:hypothetical protein n=1 Tax=unclassified Curtobacterium TaxID=257496 RepID=UPI000A6B31A2|nr:hypothetical protein [Curtobacterium sp. MCBA15_004]WIA95381.1 hypothetical protein QOL16_09510 [Curtobacterium sp. MCBA15_004]